MVWSYACHFYFLLLQSIMAARPPFFNFSYFVSKERYVRLTFNFKRWNHQSVDLMFWNALWRIFLPSPPPPSPLLDLPPHSTPLHTDPSATDSWIRFCKPWYNDHWRAPHELFLKKGVPLQFSSGWELFFSK